MATKQSSNGAAPGGRAIKMIQSKIHGRGVIATRDIAAGEKIVEYVGEIITPGEADRRYPFEEDKPHHTFLEFSFGSERYRNNCDQVICPIRAGFQKLCSLVFADISAIRFGHP